MPAPSRAATAAAIPDEGATIHGRCVDRAGEPWEGLPVELDFTLETTSGPDGRFVFSNIEARSFRIAVTAHGEHRFGIVGRARPSEITEVEIVIPRTLTLRGRLRFSDGRPATDRDVGVMRWWKDVPGSLSFAMLVDLTPTPGHHDYSTQTDAEGRFALPVSDPAAAEVWVVSTTNPTRPITYRILTAAEMEAPPFVELVLLEPARLHGHIRWSDGEPARDFQVKPRGSEEGKYMWTDQGGGRSGPDGTFELIVTPETVAVEAQGPEGFSVRQEVPNLMCGEDRELHLVIPRPVDTDTVTVLFVDEAGEEIPSWYGMAWEEFRHYPLWNAVLRLSCPDDPSCPVRTQTTSHNPEVVQLEDGREFFLELVRNNKRVSEGVWLRGPGTVTLTVKAVGGTPRSLRLRFPPDDTSPRGFRYRVGDLAAPAQSPHGRPRRPSERSMRGIMIDLGLQEGGTLPIYLSTVGLRGSELGLAHRLLVSIPEEGDPSPIDVVPHPLVELDRSSIPEGFSLLDCEIEILDGSGTIVWRNHLAPYVKPEEEISLPLPPHGTIRARHETGWIRLY